jgi:hypothetical protein
MAGSGLLGGVGPAAVGMLTATAPPGSPARADVAERAKNVTLQTIALLRVRTRKTTPLSSACGVS